MRSASSFQLKIVNIDIVYIVNIFWLDLYRISGGVNAYSQKYDNVLCFEVVDISLTVITT